MGSFDLAATDPFVSLRGDSIALPGDIHVFCTRIPVGDFRSLEVHLESGAGTADLSFRALWENYDPTTDSYVSGRSCSWHMREPLVGAAELMSDRVPNLGDYLTFTVEPGLGGDGTIHVNGVQLRFTNREPCALPPERGTIEELLNSPPGYPLDGLGDMLLVLAAKVIAGGTQQIWNLPPYHGPANFSLIAAGAGSGVNINARTYNNADAPLSPGGAIIGRLSAPDDAAELWLPPRINTVTLFAAAGVASTMWLTATARRGPST